MRARLAVALLASSLLAGCAPKRFCPRVSHEAGRPSSTEPVVYLKSLGVAGFLIQYDGLSVLTAPLYSNPTLGEIATQPAYTDHRLIDALLPKVDNVAAILSGHSHYDHLMDVPYIAMEKARSARVYGNDEMLRLLAPLSGLGEPLKGRLVSVEPLARKLEEVRRLESCSDSTAFQVAGEDGRIRIWPIVSEHSSQFDIPILGSLAGLPPVHLWRGRTLRDANTLPRTPGDWAEGTTLAYLVDFLSRDDPSRVALRVYFQDSGSREPYGFPPPCLLRERPVDLAIVTVGGWKMVDSHPGAIVKALAPDFVVASHWEDFFNPRVLPLPRGFAGNACCETVSEAPGQDTGKFEAKLARALPRQGRYAVPCPDSWTILSPSGDIEQPWQLRASTTRWFRGRSEK